MLIAGIDEAGRGPCLGPLTLGIALIEKNNEEKLIELKVRDSKELTAYQRNSIYSKLNEALKNFSFLNVSAEELDSLMQRKSLNEIEAIKIAELLNSLNEKPEIIFVDSPDPIQENFAVRIKKYLGFKVKIIAEHKADSTYPIVSAASIIAKVQRDKAINELKKEFGEIGSGYSHDEVTIKYLKEFIKQNNALPFFARKKWETTQRLMNEKFQQKLL